MPSRWSRRQCASTIVAALALLAAVLGFGALRTESRADVVQPDAVAISAGPVSGPMQLNNDSVSVRRLGVGSTVNDDKAFKSGGVKRDRLTALAFSTPRSAGSAVPPTVGVIWSAQRVDVPARAPSLCSTDQNLLIRFCVARC